MSKTEFFFSAADYAVFDNGLGNNPEYDGEREGVKDKLVTLHHAIYPIIRKNKWDLHPHWMSQWLISAWRISPATPRIDFMTLRYSKPETTIQLMKKELFEDFGHFYANAMIALRIDKDGFAVELYAGERAWVDGQNLKQRIQSSVAERGYFRTLLAELGGEHTLRLTQFVRNDDGFGRSEEILRARASRLVNVGMLNATIEKYKPGGHDLRLGICYKPHDQRLAADHIVNEVITRIGQLYPIYQFMSWSPKNNFRTQSNVHQKPSRRSR